MQLGTLNSAEMRKDKATKAIGTRAITQYTTPRQSMQRLTLRACKNEDDPPVGDTLEPTRVDLMNAIQSLCSALDRDIKTVSIDLNLLRADLR
ncbi:hypothetical protein NDU88_003275 [Pleurodeles waltl]|uniref:Uncharacterized protein n=1 Tax=Pleurodeles waltl TaxID=8319 RepID=A0AAV7V0U7_PLEWA|nr:hypothetical protein NDU88_003275 [Pleurodeles waltl]